MSSSESCVRFWHLSDLHLTWSCDACDAGICGRTQACWVAIKTNIISILAAELLRSDAPPHLLLFSGDILESAKNPSDMRLAAARLEPLLAAARARGTRILGVAGTRGHDHLVTAAKKNLGWNWLLETGQQHECGGVKVVGVNGDSEKESAAEARSISPPTGPSILVAHALKLETALNMGFNYCALGHIHWARIERRDQAHVAAHPGHLYSYWDGSGKAWPVFILEGAIDTKDGRVMVERVPLEDPPFNVPATRQLYIDYKDRAAKSGELHLVHAPYQPWFYLDAKLPTPKLVAVNTGALRATFAYENLLVRDSLVRTILNRCENDIFVSLAQEDQSKRVINYGRNLLGDDEFSKFMTTCIMQEPNKQTSDK